MVSTDFSLLYGQTRKYYNDEEKITEINVPAKYFSNIKIMECESSLNIRSTSSTSTEEPVEVMLRIDGLSLIFGDPDTI